MNRLTKNGKYENYEPIKPSNLYPAINKLGQLEDIEEKLDIDLIKILTAKEVYVFGTEVVAPHRLGRTNKIVKCSIFYFNFINEVVHIHVPKVGLYCETFSDYGKTWAFTRGELENELN